MKLRQVGWINRHPKYRAPAQRFGEMGGRRPRDGGTIVLMGLAVAWEHGSGQGKLDWVRERLGVSGIKWTAWGKPEGWRTQFTISIIRSIHPGGDDCSCLENIRGLASPSRLPQSSSLSNLMAFLKTTRGSETTDSLSTSRLSWDVYFGQLQAEGLRSVGSHL